MIANYHTHTWRCRHASGTERSYVEAAIEGGLQILGFSDHTPMPYEGDYKSGVKMGMEELEDYVDTVLALKEEYAGDICICLGLETEYYPKYWNALLDVTETYPIEYFLLGQHFVGNEIGEPFCGEPTDSEEMLARYVSQTAEALETGLFTYFAHPDVINYRGDQAVYERYMRKLCENAKRVGVPLEINLLGLETARNYPNPVFWRIAAETGNEVILGSDAHQSENVVNRGAIRQAEIFAGELGLTLIDTVEVVPPVRRR